MSSGQAGSPDAAADPNAPSMGWREELKQRQEAAQAASGDGTATSGGGGGGTVVSGGGGGTFWWMRTDSPSTSLNYFIPIGERVGYVVVYCDCPIALTFGHQTRW